MHQYADAVIGQDERRWSNTWAPDATWVLPGGRTAVGRNAIVELWRASLSKYVSVIQVAHTGSVTLGPASTHASGRWPITEHFKKHNGEVGLLLDDYDDEYIRTADGWCFASRALTVHYQGPPDLTGRFSAESTTSKGRPANDDQ